MNKIIALVAFVVFLGLAGMVAWQSSGADSEAPPRPGTMEFYRAQRATESAIREQTAPMTDLLNCLAAGHTGEYCNEQNEHYYDED